MQSRYYDPAIGRFLNADGLRFGRVDGTNSYYYIYDGNKNLSRLMYNDQVMDFVYSGNTPVVMICNDSVYFYATNLQSRGNFCIRY